jgi:hypothetical protein
VKRCPREEEKQRDASDGREWHSWIERTSESRNGARSDLTALLVLGDER